MLIIPLILSHAFLTPDGYSCEPKIDKGNIVISRQIDSYYDTQNKNIYLCPQILGDTERTKYAYYHEFGHWTFYNFLTREEQNYW